MRKHSQKINYDVILHYISLLIYPLHFPKFCPIKKQFKKTKKMLVFGENDSLRLSNFLKAHFFGNFDHIYRIYNQINYRTICFPKVIIILVMTVFFNVFFPKKTRTLMPLSILKMNLKQNTYLYCIIILPT